jgi:purine-binding chemotaxis protein CheW
MSQATTSAEQERVRLHDDGFVTFRLGEQWLGIPVVLIQEVLTAQSVSRVPRSPSHVAGFLNLRGQIVTAVDLRVRLGLPPHDDPEADAMNVVVKDGEEFFSLVVDQVGDVVAVDAERVEPAPATLPGVWREVASGVIQMEEELLVILDVDRILDSEASRAA